MRAKSVCMFPATRVLSVGPTDAWFHHRSAFVSLAPYPCRPVCALSPSDRKKSRTEEEGEERGTSYGCLLWEEVAEGRGFTALFFYRCVLSFRSCLSLLSASGVLHCLCISSSDGGSMVGSVGSDQTFRLFEVISFDMLCLLKLPFMPLACEFVHGKEELAPIVAM